MSGFFGSMEVHGGERLESQKLESPEAVEQEAKKPESVDAPENGGQLDAARIIKDDSGNEINNGSELRANDTFIKHGIEYKTDDDSQIYSADGHLRANTTYKLNGNIYTTDENGRIIKCEAKPVRSPENPRDLEAQREAGHEDRRSNDQGGHIIGRDMNGDGGIGNLVAMDSKINQSDFKRMENDINVVVDDGKDVATKTQIAYRDDSKRPDIITVTVTADGKDYVYKFDNNLDGALRDRVPENGKETVQSRLYETGGEISSIKEEYNKSGSVIETTVYITYKGDDGKNYRISALL